jgi:hypothetical protein
MLAAACLLAAPLAGGAIAQDVPNAPNAPAPQPPAPIAPSRPVGVLPEPKLIVNAFDYVTERFGDGSGEPANGFYPELSNMITGSGWVSVGPGYRHYFFDDQLLIDGSTAVSWHLYSMVQGRVELPKLANGRLALGAQAMRQDQTQVSYFGVGPNTTDDDRSQYRMQVRDIVGYAKITAPDWLAFTGEVGWIGRPKVMAPSGTFRGDFPDLHAAFPHDPGVSLEMQPSLAHAEAAVTADTRDHRGHPTSGFMYRAALTNYTDQDTGLFSHRQYEAEALQLIPIVGQKWLLALHGWSVYSDVPFGHQIPFYLMPALGGHNTLRDYSNFQFHDNNILVANAEGRVGLTAHIDGAVFFDAGNVGSRYSDLNLAKTSYGVGLRLHNDTTTFARLDVAQGAQGWRVVLRTSEPLRLSRVRRQIAAVPFMP